MFSSPPDAVSCTHRCHRMRAASFSFYSTSADSFSLHIQPAQPPSPQPNSSNLPLAILGPVARTDLPQLGPSLLPEPPHSSSCRTPLPSASMASHMHHISTITPGPHLCSSGIPHIDMLPTHHNGHRYPCPPPLPLLGHGSSSFRFPCLCPPFQPNLSHFGLWAYPRGCDYWT